MDQKQTILPGAVNGTHLVECPHCHAANGITAVRCWSCDRALPPELKAVPESDIAMEGAWPTNAFHGVGVEGLAAVPDSAAAANTAAFDARTDSMDAPQTSRSERRARLAASAAADSSLAMPNDLFVEKALPAGPIVVGDALTQAGLSTDAEVQRVAPQSSTLDEQAKAAISEWKPEPWKPSPPLGTPDGPPASPNAAAAATAASSSTAASVEPAALAAGLEPAAAKPAEFFPQFAPIRTAARASARPASMEAAPASTAAQPANTTAAHAPPLSANLRTPEAAHGGPSSNPEGRPRRMTPEEIAATFRAPIRRHAWQDPRWIGAGFAVLALAIGLGVYFYSSTVDESDWTPASTRGLVEQRGSVRNPQAILDGDAPEPTAGRAAALSSTPAANPAAARPTRDPQAILNGEPTSAGADPAAAADVPVTATAAPPEPAAITTAPVAPSVAEPPAVTNWGATAAPTAPTQSSAAPATPSPNAPTTACAPNVQALGLCGAP